MATVDKSAKATEQQQQEQRRQQQQLSTGAPTNTSTGIAPPVTTTGPLALIEVGFWADPRDPDDGRPVPARLVDMEWGMTVAARAVALYARSGYLESFELGYSFCRLGCGVGGGGGSIHSEASQGREEDRKFMGCCTLTDGEYVWPEGLAHYISEHSVRPPEAFVSRALGNLRVLRAAQAGGRLRWDPEGTGKTTALAPGTASFLRDKTTLGIALPAEPELSGKAGSGGACSCVPS